MTPNDIYKALAEIRDKFPKSSKMLLDSLNKPARPEHLKAPLSEEP
jgi:hypothetical protein